jgi:hypothetical protein
VIGRGYVSDTVIARLKLAPEVEAVRT